LHRIRAALDAAFALAVWAGAVLLSLHLCWELALLVGGLFGLLAVYLGERR
jgi:hypothetical protein